MPENCLAWIVNHAVLNQEMKLPQLPSGRHVALDPKRFADLMSNANHFGNVHKVMAIDSIATLMPWLDVMYLVEPGTGIQNLEKYELADSSFTPPMGFLAFKTNCKLSRWETLAKDWSLDDRVAMRVFLSSERCSDYLHHFLSVAKSQQELFHESDDFLTKLLAGWHSLGIHPAQEEDWNESDSPIWDSYDMLAALGDVVQYVEEKKELYERHLQIFDRATGVWNMFLTRYPFLRTPIAIHSDVRAVAKLWRDAEYLESLPDETQVWIRQQMMIECINLWNHAEDVLMDHCKNAFDIICLVTLSPEANTFL
jgi:hypothetical protein